jgi:hypothetical protein
LRRFMLAQLLAGAVLAVMWLMVFSLLLGSSIIMLVSSAVALWLTALAANFFFSRPLLTISALSSYETDKSVEDCWEEAKSMDGYGVRNFGHVEVVDRRDDELVFEVTYPRFMGQAAKRTVRCRRSGDKHPESMKIDIFVDDKHVGQDLIRIGRVGNKTVVEYETTYDAKQTPSDYLFYKLVGRYTPQIAKALGYRKRKSQRTISFR